MCTQRRMLSNRLRLGTVVGIHGLLGNVRHGLTIARANDFDGGIVQRRFMLGLEY